MDYTSHKNQRILGEFVRRNVIYCVTGIISELYVMEKYSDELYDVMYRSVETVDLNQYRYVIDLDERGKFEADVREIDEDGEDRETIWEIDTKLAGQLVVDGVVKDVTDEGEIEDYLKHQGIIPKNATVIAENDEPLTTEDEHEAYEHWLVDRWFGKKLGEHGEMVIFDFLGLECIWGRTCTGQAILLDHVIGEIAEEMEILEGQKYEWEV